MVCENHAPFWTLPCKQGGGTGGLGLKAGWGMEWEGAEGWSGAVGLGTLLLPQGP